MRAAFWFFALVMLVSAPFWVLGLLFPLRLPFGLPVSAAMILVPAGVATVLAEDAGALWRGLFDLGRVPLAAGLAVLTIMPLATTGSRLWAGMPVAPLPLSDLPIMLALYLPGAALEEVGWTGFATPRLQPRLGVLGAGLVIGTVWALWHVVPWALGQGHSGLWVLGQSLSAVAIRLVMGVIFARLGQSLALAVLFHTAINVAGSFAPPPASYDPMALAVILVIALGLLVVLLPKPVEDRQGI